MRVPEILQSESAECGLACIAMICHAYGNRSSLGDLRDELGMSASGATIGHLKQVAKILHLESRAVQVSLDRLTYLRRPCILHWRFNHYVVLTKVKKNWIEIHDPAAGKFRLSMDVASTAFTGVALELWPASDFENKAPGHSASIRTLFGRVQGIAKAAASVAILAVTLDLFTVLTPMLSQMIIDASISAADMTLLSVAVAATIAAVIIQAAIFAARRWATVYFNSSLTIQWRRRMFARLIRLPIQWFERRTLGDVVSRFSSADAIQNTISTTAVEATLDATFAVVTVFVLYLYSPVLTLIAFLGTAIYVVVRVLMHRRLLQAESARVISEARQNTAFLETARGIRPIKILSGEANREAKWSGLFIDSVNCNVRVETLRIWYESGRIAIFGCQRALALGVGAFAVMEGQLTIGALIAALAYVDQIERRASTFIESMFRFRMLRVHVERVAEVVTAATTDDVEEASRSGPEREIGSWEIELQDVTYKYAINETLVLKGVSLFVHSGEAVAITGPSGGGKSTLVSILLGLMPPTTGRILVGGEELPQHSQRAYRTGVAAILQDDTLFTGSLLNNISFFDVAPDMQWVEECARKAQILDEIMKMPMRFNSQVGDLGSTLSGGQRQRILIARALYRRPKILIMDEATSHLDVATESKISAEIAELKCTRVIVAHREETIATADRVYILQNGVVSPRTGF